MAFRLIAPDTHHMPIPYNHPSITLAGVAVDLQHLQAFGCSIPGKGVKAGTDLHVVVVFSCHVFTERAKHGQLYDVVDHHGTPRTFDQDRYEMSKELPDRIRAKVQGDALTFVSKSFGGTDNLILLEDRHGSMWSIVYCLCSTDDHTAIRLEVLSAHPKTVNQKKISRRNLSYFARMCLFQKLDRIPKL